MLRTLCRAGLLESERGAGGGYRFVANRRRVTLMDVIERFEPVDTAPPRRAPPADATGGPPTPAEIEGAIALVLAEIGETARATFRSVTLETMLKLIERRRR